MGTNFYKVIPIPNDTKRILKDKIDKEEFTINEYGDISFNDIWDLDLKPNEIHIGKRSGGWKFLFDYNNWKYFDKTEKSLLDWIYDDSDDSIIKDEYGEVYTREEFMKEVDKTYELREDGKENWDHKSYYEDNPDDFCREEILDMYLGKYRVSTYTNFS